MTSGKRKSHSLLYKLLTVNGALTLALLLLCSGLFVMAIYRIMDKYVNYDIDFFLTQMAGNLEKKVSYMEEALQNIRKEPVLMNYLNNTESTGDEELSLLFSRTVDLNSDTNMGDGLGALVDELYLFREDGNSLSAYYYALSESDYRERQTQAQASFQALSFGGEEPEDCVVYPVLDDTMNKKGILLFYLNKDSIRASMEEVKNYENAFWVVFDEDRTYVSNDGVSAENFLIMENREDKKAPYNETFMEKKGEYRIFEKELSLGLRVAIGIPRNQMATVLNQSIYLYFAGIIVIMVLAGAAFAFYSVKVTRPLRELMERIRGVKEGDFVTRLPEYEEKEFQEISTVFNEMTDHMNHLINEVYEKQLAIRDMDLKFAQSQMNPHFMFNVLNSISLQAKMDGNEEVFRMLTSFSRLIQAKIYRSDREKVRVWEELEYVSYYLSLQNYRYGEALEYYVMAEEGIRDCLLPKLCIQLLVENSVAHGLEPKMGQGKVEVSIKKEEERLHIVICDNGVGFPGSDGGRIELPIVPRKETGHNQVGINNLNHILKILYGSGYELIIQSKENEGTTVNLWLPTEWEET